MSEETTHTHCFARTKHAGMTPMVCFEDSPAPVLDSSGSRDLVSIEGELASDVGRAMDCVHPTMYRYTLGYVLETANASSASVLCRTFCASFDACHSQTGWTGAVVKSPRLSSCASPISAFGCVARPVDTGDPYPINSCYGYGSLLSWGLADVYSQIRFAR